MNGVWLLSWRHVLHHRTQTLIVVLCLAVSMMLPVTSQVLVTRYQTELLARAAATPLVAGARGSRFDLTLAALYFRQRDLEIIQSREYHEIRDSRLGVVIPINARFTAQDIGIVGVGFEYFEQRGIVAARGTLPLQLGDVVLGSTAASRLGLGPGDALFSDQKDLYDISRPAALKMRVSGVLAPTGSPDDDVVFVDLKTTWILEGLAHGHDDAASEVDESLLIGRTDDVVVISEALIHYNEVTAENMASFHVHGGRDDLPLSAIIVFPNDEQARTILKARINNTSDTLQMVVPTAVIEDLMSVVFRIKTLFDGIAAVLGLSTLLLTALVLVLSMRLRAKEMRTLHRLGCSRFIEAQLYAVELGVIIALAIVIAGAGVGIVLGTMPSLLDVV